MTTPPPPPQQPFVAGDAPFAGFEVTVITDRSVYAVGDTVRITVTATNGAHRLVEHTYPGWQRFVTTVRDRYHRPIATDELPQAMEASSTVAVARHGRSVPGEASVDFRDRWLPGQMVIFPLYWAQHEGPLIPGWSDLPPGPRAEPGSYRVRVSWLGREPGGAATYADVWSGWFELV